MAAGGRTRLEPSLLIVLVLWCASVAPAQETRTSDSARKGSELSIVAANVQMLLVAPSGKKTGFEAKSQKIAREIPNSAYYQDALLEYDSGRVDPNTTQTLDVKKPQAGRYRLLVAPGTAADGEEYEIRVTLYLQRGDEARTARIAGTAEHDTTATYEIRVSGGAEGTVAVKQVSQSTR